MTYRATLIIDAENIEIANLLVEEITMVAGKTIEGDRAWCFSKVELAPKQLNPKLKHIP